MRMCHSVVIYFYGFLDRLRMAKLDLSVNQAEDANSDRRRQLKLSFQADTIKTPSIIKSPIIPDRTRYELLNLYMNFE